MQNEPFELLYDAAMMALLDGYSRESVASFAASNERFQEFCCRAITIASGVNAASWKDIWKLVSNSSERQFGAFVLLYRTYMGRNPVEPKSDKKWREFGNKVVHKGCLPQRQEVLEYARYLCDHMHLVLKELRSRVGESVNQVSTERMLINEQVWRDKEKGSHQYDRQGYSPTIQSVGTMVDILRKDFMGFDDALAELQNYRRLLYSP